MFNNKNFVLRSTPFQWPDANSVEIFLVRLDELHEHYGGNKWFKLKHNLQRAKEFDFKRIVTFGGAYSNHLRATAAAAKELDFDLVCVVRGERVEPLNPVLGLVERLGGKLHFVSREQYRLKEDANFLQQLQSLYGPAYVIPEGGANELGVLGCSEIPGLIDKPFDVVVCACGTFTTLAGLSLGLKPNQQALGISVLKANGYGEKQTNDLVEQTTKQFPHLIKGIFTVNDDYHFGGYAKTSATLETFRLKLLNEFNVETDFVYTAKLLYAITDLISKNHFKPGTRIAVLMSNASNAAM